uniref:NAD-dependent epimerase/dehydratase family protein n=1 Tax=Aquiluna sp. TaxID=2053504 RepID=UPI004048C08B
MKVLVSGSSGLIGTELLKQLKAAGHQPIRLVRTAPKSDNEFQWSPQEGKIPEGIMEEVDAVVNLNGATTSRIPWTPGYVKKLISSRLLSTRLLVEAINAAKTPPKVFVSGSAEGYYGNGGDKVLTEESPLGTGFMAELTNDWEQEAKKAKIRTVLVRTTLAMSKNAIAL